MQTFTGVLIDTFPHAIHFPDYLYSDSCSRSVCCRLYWNGYSGCSYPDSDPAPLAGDPALGVWAASEQTTQTDSGTITEISTNYIITISSDGSGSVAYDYKERKGFSSTSNHYAMDGTVSKNENVYTIDAQLLGKYVVTLSADGSAVLTIPAGSELPLHKSEV